jgi:feruloyl esterase
MDFWRRSTLFGVAVSQLTLVTACNTLADCCATLTPSTSLSEYNTTILNTTYYATGKLDAEGLRNEVPFCEVYSSVSYGDNDTLIFALWLPDAAVYGSRFMAVGNGGYAGVISYNAMMVELNSGLGLAVAGSDAGHQGPGMGAPGVYEPFLHDIDQVSAWLHDGISLFTPPSKKLINIFYGQEASYSYYTGCSTGGAQGFSLAQLYPDMFDGIIAGGPVNWFTGNLLSFLWNAQHTEVCFPFQGCMNFLTDTTRKFLAV